MCGGVPWNMMKEVKTEKSNIPQMVPAVPLKVAAPGNTTPTAEAAEETVDEEADAVDAHAEQYTGISMSSDSSPSSSSSSEPLGMQEDEATGTKRERGSDNGSDEGERLIRLAAMCAALGGPHEENNFMEAPPSEDELYEARCRELKQLIDFDVFEEISPEDLPKGTRVITTTWVDRRKTPTEVKSRICARDFNTGKRDDVFAATPGAASARSIDFIAAKFGYRKLVGDVSAAFLHARVPDGVWIVVRPPAGHETKIPGALWKLNRMLYGLRDAPAAWQNHLSDLLVAAGYQRGVFEPSLFWHPEHHVYVLVHVDDLHATGPDHAVQQLMKDLQKELVMKISKMMGEDDEYSFLKAVRGMTKDSVTMWPQDGYILETAKQLELDTSRGATTPMTKLKEEKDDLEPLSSLLATLYRSAVGRLLYLSHARFDIQYACRRLCQGMRAPTCIDLRHLRHLTRYLLRTRGFGLVFPRGGAGDLEYIDVYVDSDWAGKENMRKSTSGGCIMVGGCCMVNWSRGQTVIAQSSGEAEFYAIIAGAHEGLAVQSTLAEIGIVLKLRVWSDSSAARTMCHRLGAGSLKHVETKHFHIQHLLAEGKLTVEKVGTEENPGDLGTKAATVKMLADKLHLTGLADVRGCRSEQTIAAIRTDTTGKGGGKGSVNAATLQALIGLLQCLSVKGEQKEYETNNLEWIVPLMMISGVAFWFYCTYRVTTALRSFTARTSWRSVGIQTDVVPDPVALVPAVPVQVPAPGLRLPSEVYFAPANGRCYHVHRYCAGLGNSNDVVSRRVCRTCNGQMD